MGPNTYSEKKPKFLNWSKTSSSDYDYFSYATAGEDGRLAVGGQGDIILNRLGQDEVPWDQSSFK